MERVMRVVVIGLVLAIMGLTNAFSEEKKLKFGVGFQASFPAWGLSGLVDLDEKSSIQGVLGPFGDLKAYAGRYLYRFKMDPTKKYWNVYGYGSVGAWSYTWSYRWTGYKWEEKTETVLGFGGGVGVEYNWQVWSPNLPPVWWNGEIGIAMVDFKEADYNVSALQFGLGGHVRF